MTTAIGTRIRLLAICAGALLVGCLGTVPAASADFDDPLFVFRPLKPPPEVKPEPPPVGDFEGPCGIGVSSSNGNFFVSDHLHHAVDVFGSGTAYGGQIAGVEPLTPSGQPVEKTDVPVDGPCGISLDASDVLYVNIYHRSVVKFATFPMEAKDGVVITGAPVDSARPTGVAASTATGDVYVNDRTHLAIFDSTGAPKGTIGAGSIGDAYGLAISQYTTTAGWLYVPDKASNTIKVFNPAASTVTPVATIDGHDTPKGEFTSLDDAAIAVDDVTGEIYVSDTLQPENTERPETTIHVFNFNGTYKGRLKYNIVNAFPPGLAVDNSATETQGRVYVTTENSERAAIMAYPPGAATSKSLPAPPLPAPESEEEEELGGGEESSVVGVLAPAATSAATIAPAAEQAPAIAQRPRSKARKRNKAKRNRARRAAKHRNGKRGSR